EKETHNTQNNASIYLAQKELLLSLDKEGQTLVDFEALIAKESQTLKGGKLEAKIADYQDLLKRVKTHLGYSYEVHFPSTPFILIADDLLPSDIQKLEPSAVQGVILKKTSATSHTAILLRASGITSLILNTDISKGKETVSKKTVILDTQAGVLVLSPSVDDIEKAKETQKLHASQKEKSHTKRHQKAQTKIGKHIAVLANVADVDSAKLAKEEGAEGIGLLRTEFLFTEQKPSLEAQTKAYAEIFELFDDVTVRTLDVGGDKALPYITLPEESNPFLGIRGIRLLKTHPEIISEQLHAIFIAAKNRPIKVMFPMVSTVEEFNEAKSFSQNIAQKHEIDISNILFGIMIEVPSVLFLIKDFNKVVDFYSIGTNDLSQYLFATERTHPSLAVDELSPVIFTALSNIIKQATKPVSICGELASNKGAIGKLIGLGLDTFSVTPKSIAQTKESVRHV
ncbi:MAG TPA: phosphoenolpyruvate--protein phosphotransferase, partial [Sulfurovum sp.]|nr:phosphoenolpyruvate--protein phosphotransferase [Sulfurovum sp.]